MDTVVAHKPERVFLRPPAALGSVNEIIELVNDPRTSIARLTSAIAKDKALMDRVLRQANSPLLGLAQRVQNPDHAVVLLGFDALKEMVIRSVVTGAFRRMVDTFVRFESFWNHSVGCALGARLIASETGACDPNDAFVAGLLHDIGYIVINMTIMEKFAANANPRPIQDLVVSPATEGKQGHPGIGAMLAEQWGLAPDIVEAIGFHHHPSLATVNPPLVAVVHIAEVLCYHLAVSTPDYESAHEYDEHAMNCLGLDPAVLESSSSEGYTVLFKEHCSRAPQFRTFVQELRNNLVEVMGNLGEQERVVLALLYYEGLTVSEIANVMDTSIPEIQFLHNAALARLRAAVTMMV